MGQKPPAASLRPKLQLSPLAIERGIERLDKCIGELSEFNILTLVDGESQKLDSLTLTIKDILERCFGENSSAYQRFIAAANLRYGGALEILSGQVPDYSGNVRKNINRSLGLLKAAQDTLQEDLAEHENSIVSTSSDAGAAAALSKRVFVVHGHEEGPREAVARFLMQLGFEPIILHEQANQGRTIMEKVEAHGQVDFAVVLLTPDDEGCAKGGKPEPRARQNVLLELGYFLGRLGRDKVCALKRGTVEIPSDFAGVVWESMDGNSWKQALGRELKAAGHEIDWNKVMRA
jgi:predicted nucleotide-binding protein